jgi:hypothetical protein
MSELGIVSCDRCGSRVDDRYLAKGWIRLEGSIVGTNRFNITMSRGRKKNGQAMTKYEEFSRLDFCGVDCGRKWLLAYATSSKGKH